MMQLELGGYGGEYSIGKLTEDEIKNIQILLNRFESELFIGRFDSSFSENRYSFNEFDDVYVGWGPCDMNLIQDSTGTVEFEPEQVGDEVFQRVTATESGFYLLSCSAEKGHFCSVNIDIEPEDFDLSKFTLIKDDLSETWLNDCVISGATYDGTDLELDFDDCSTTGKSFDQVLMYYDAEEDEWYNGFFEIENTNSPKYELIDEIAFGDEVGILTQYIELAKNQNPIDEVELKEGTMVYFSPMIEDVYGMEVCERLWLSDRSHIQSAKLFNMLDQVPENVYEKIVNEKPEWLI